LQQAIGAKSKIQGLLLRTENEQQLKQNGLDDLLSLAMDPIELITQLYAQKSEEALEKPGN